MNSAIVRVPGRVFPGVVIQGDSLSNLFNLAMDVVEASSKTANFGPHEAAEELAQKLFAHIRDYESVLEARGIRLPYVRDPKRVPHVINPDGGTA
jgi:hypothetical protein